MEKIFLGQRTRCRIMSMTMSALFTKERATFGYMCLPTCLHTFLHISTCQHTYATDYFEVALRCTIGDARETKRKVKSKRSFRPWHFALTDES